MRRRAIDNFLARKEITKYEAQLRPAERTAFRRLIKYNPPGDAFAVILQGRMTDTPEEDARWRAEVEALFEARLHDVRPDNSPLDYFGTLIPTTEVWHRMRHN